MCDRYSIHEAAAMLGVPAHILRRAVINGGLCSTAKAVEVTWADGRTRSETRYLVSLDDARAYLDHYEPPPERVAAQIKITAADVARCQRMRAIEAMRDEDDLQAKLREVWE